MGKLRLRETYIRDYENLPNSGSRSWPINIVDPIPDIYLKFTARNYSDSNIRNFLFDVVNEIEVIDGSDVLFSLKPREILALDAYHYKESLHWGITEVPSAYQKCVFKIPFGIGRYDPTIGFDPTRFKNPQLRFNWNLENISPVGAGGFVTGSLFVDVIATVAEKFPVRPSGWLMHKHIHEWETAASGVHRVEMPVDYPHRSVFLQHKESFYCPWEVLSKAKYNVDQEKYMPFNWHTDDWSYWLKEFYGMWHQGMNFMPTIETSGVLQWRHFYLMDNRSFSMLSKDAAVPWWWSQGTGCKVFFSGGTGATNIAHVKIDGSLPFGTWTYPFGDPEQLEEWLQVRDIGKIYFEIEQGGPDEVGEGDTARVFLTQYRTY